MRMRRTIIIIISSPVQYASWSAQCFGRMIRPHHDPSGGPQWIPAEDPVGQVPVVHPAEDASG